MHPVTSYGGNVCCQGNAVTGGSFDQRKMEARPDILVYTSEPFKEGTEVSGPITPTLYVSSDAKDTDFTVKVIDVYPDGRAYNLDESIQRMRYRDGYDKPLVWMEPGKVYKVTLQPLNTSNYFAAGHRLRIEVSSSNFPRFDRNLNTGGNNYDETKGVVAHNVVHHSAQYPSGGGLSPWGGGLRSVPVRSLLEGGGVWLVVLGPLAHVCGFSVARRLRHGLALVKEPLTSITVGVWPFSSAPDWLVRVRLRVRQRVVGSAWFSRVSSALRRSRWRCSVRPQPPDPQAHPDRLGASWRSSAPYPRQ